MVELISVLVIGAILAALSTQRFFDKGAFDSHGFHQQVVSALRYAQNAAIAQNSFVCVALTASSVTLSTNTTASCPGSNLAAPSGGSTYSVSAPSSNITLSGYTTPFYFDALGKPSASQSIAVSNYSTPVVVEAETGYVH